MEHIIQIDHLSKSFGSVKAVQDLSFRVKEGELFAFLGVNGAGKSTTINIMCGQLSKDGGSVVMDAHDLDKDMDFIKRELGVVFQSSVLDSALSVYDNLESRAALYGITGTAFKKRLAELAEILDFEDLLKRAVGKLSGGQRRRIDIARVLFHKPKIIILDEPTTGLDPNQIFGIRKIIKEIGEEKTVILSSHILSEIETTCDQVMIMSNGKIVANGTTSELRRKSDAEYCLKIGIKGGATTNIHEALNDLPGVLHIEIIHKQNFELQCKPDVEIEKSIFNLCQENNWYISELTPVQTRLEDIFRKVTQNE